MKLHEIASELRSLHEPGDTEAAHARADELLIEALLTFRLPGPYTIQEIEDLVHAYRGVPKWFA